MKPALAAIALGFVVGGCRALIGIDDLAPAPPSDGDGARDSGLVERCGRDKECPRCCKDNNAAFRSAFEGSSPGGQCLCKPELGCTARCATAGKQCGAAPAAGELDDCLRCTDDVLRTSDEPCLEDACKGDPDCLEGLACFRACKP